MIHTSESMITTYTRYKMVDTFQRDRLRDQGSPSAVMYLGYSTLIGCHCVSPPVWSLCLSHIYFVHTNNIAGYARRCDLIPLPRFSLKPLLSRI